MSHGDKDGIPSAKDSGGHPQDRIGLLLLQGREGGGVQLEKVLLGEQGEPDDEDDQVREGDPAVLGSRKRNQGRINDSAKDTLI